ncbi:hypothetical protein [Pedobacter ginsengiterrae]|uniref:hypothetical protein n=1 Tax=Pedobacter ginsengiterrae TaxID=871696 RepID=UPI0031D53B7E
MNPSERLVNQFGPERLRALGMVSVLAGSIEFRLERLIWTLSKELVEGNKPSTDTKPVSFLLENLVNLSEGITQPELQGIFRRWIQIAKPAFRCRNSILHGLAIVYSNTEAEFITNTRWAGEQRKRASSSFHANEHTLGLLSSIFETLLDSMIALQYYLNGQIELESFFTPEYTRSMREQRSIANEIVDLAAAVNHEKY